MHCLPIGSERQCERDRTIQVKVAQPNKWREKSHIEWEKHHDKVPSGSIISYLDNDPSNYHIDNIRLMTRAEHGSLMNADTKNMNAEHKEVMINIAKLSAKTRSLDNT